MDPMQLETIAKHSSTIISLLYMIFFIVCQNSRVDKFRLVYQLQSNLRGQFTTSKKEEGKNTTKTFL